MGQILNATNPEVLASLVGSVRFLLNHGSYSAGPAPDTATLAFGGPRLEIGGVPFFLTPDGLPELNSLARGISGLPHASDVVSYARAYEATMQIVGIALSNQVPGASVDATGVLREILQACLADKREFTFWFPVAGVALTDISLLTLGPAELFRFSEANATEIDRSRTSPHAGSAFEQETDAWLRQYYLGRTCVRVCSQGDADKAQEVAFDTLAQVISVLRFIACLVYPTSLGRQTIRITQAVGAVPGLRVSVSRQEPLGPLALSQHLHDGRQDLEISSALVKHLQEHCFLDELASIQFIRTPNELENSISDAIYWISEAQDAPENAAAFAQYWIALEALFSTENYRLTRTLERTIPLVLAYGGFGVVPTDEIELFGRDVSALYGTRGKTVHRGRHRGITQRDAQTLGRWAVMSVLSLLAARLRGYSSHKQVRAEVQRLWELEYSFSARAESGVFHAANCSCVRGLRWADRDYFKTPQAAIAKGKRPCRRCRPNQSRTDRSNSGPPR